MNANALEKPLSPEPAVDTVHDEADPTCERILAAFEDATDTKPFDPAHVLVLVRLQRSAHEHYARILDGVLEKTDADALAPALIHGAQLLNRRIANALAQAALRLVRRPQLPQEQLRCADLALRSLRARAEEIKWHAFEQTTPPPASWQQANELVRAVESMGLERQAIAGDDSCTDAFVQCLLLATLNVGILTAPQIELAHRWLAANARGLKVEPFFDPEAHWYHIDLAAARGPERVAPCVAVSETTRFLAAAPLGARLARARMQLYAGELSVAATPNHVTALHFGAFLDLAEKLWSQDFRRTTWRAEREKADGESIEVVPGFDAVMTLLGVEDSDPQRPASHTWPLRDKSATGLGAWLPLEAGEMLRLGELMAFRHPDEEGWQLGCIVRRIRVTDASRWSIGIRRLSQSPVLVDLEAGSGELRLETEAGDETAAIYAPATTEHGRIDGLVLAAERFRGIEEFVLPTGGSAYRIRANRVLDRGEGWIRVGFEVLGKR